VIAEPGGPILETVDLLQYELDNNPDGQEHYLPDGVTPADSFSNPFSVLVQERRILVADAGANAVLSIDRDSLDISTFFVPDVVSGDDVAACATAPNNPGTTGCDPVPTGIAEGPDGLLYVSTLGSEVEGAGRVYVLDEDGKEVDRIEDLDSPTGIEVDRHGRVYVSNVVEGAPQGEGPPPADFDPATVGELTRIDRDGSRYTAQVTMPTGLTIDHGRLYASAWSIAGFLGQADRGEIVSVGWDAFTPETSEPSETTASSEPTDTTAPSEPTATTTTTSETSTSDG